MITKNNFFALKAFGTVGATSVFLWVTKPDLVWFTPIALILGYLFGKLTCGAHFKQAGLWLTVAFFILVNLAHSLVDGIAFYGIEGITRYVSVAGHELIRQPLLYVVFLAILDPFRMSRTLRWLLAFVAVTLVWFVGYEAGARVAGELSFFSETMLAQAIYFLIGDIIHHLADEYSHRHTTFA